MPFFFTSSSTANHSSLNLLILTLTIWLIQHSLLRFFFQGINYCPFLNSTYYLQSSVYSEIKWLGVMFCHIEVFVYGYKYLRILCHENLYAFLCFYKFFLCFLLNYAFNYFMSRTRDLIFYCESYSKS